MAFQENLILEKEWQASDELIYSAYVILIILQNVDSILTKLSIRHAQ